MSRPAHMGKSKPAGDRMVLPGTLRMVAWEVTRSCNLACVHCRASSVHGPYEGELDTGRCLRLIDEIAAFNGMHIHIHNLKQTLPDQQYRNTVCMIRFQFFKFSPQFFGYFCFTSFSNIRFLVI